MAYGGEYVMSDNLKLSYGVLDDDNAAEWLVVLEVGYYLWYPELVSCCVEWRRVYLAGRSHEWGLSCFKVNHR